MTLKGEIAVTAV